MGKKIQIILAFVISFTMIFTFNITSFAETALGLSTEEDQIIETVEETIEDNIEETVEETTKEVEDPIVDPIVEPIEKEEPTEDIKQEDTVDVPQEGADNPSEDNTEPPVATPEVPEPKPELQPQQQLRTESLLVSLEAEVVTNNETYTNGDEIEYEITLTNNGDLEIENIKVSDIWGVNEIVDIEPGQAQIIEGSFIIPEYNLLEEIGNIIDISATFEEESLDMELSFMVGVKIPRGSITIRNEVDNLKNSNQEFDVFISGDDGSKYTVSLKDGESTTISNLLTGDYKISSIAPMNYISNEDIDVSIKEDNEEVYTTITHSLNNTRWFYDDATEVMEDKTITTYDIDFSDYDMALRRDDIGYAEVSFNIEIEVLVPPIPEAPIPEVPETPEVPEAPEAPESSLPPEEEKSEENNLNEELDLPKEQEEESTIKD